jgi:5'-3' exonuclease
MSKEKLILVDADGLCFHSSRETLEESLQVLNDKIQNMYEKTGATHSCFFISQGRYFRHAISNDYKKSRSNTKSPLKWLQTLKMYLKEAYNANSMNLVEADDLVAYWSQRDFLLVENIPCSMPIKDFDEGTKIEPLDTLICSPDKDLLQSIEGTYFNYSYKLVDKTKPESIEKGWWVTTTEKEAYYNFWVSMITGDATDNIKGVEGRGIAYATKLFDHYGNILQEVTLSAYAERYDISQGIYEFQKNYRLLHLLSTDEDYIREIGELPTFPIVNEIKPKDPLIEYI